MCKACGLIHAHGKRFLWSQKLFSFSKQILVRLKLHLTESDTRLRGIDMHAYLCWKCRRPRPTVAGARRHTPGPAGVRGLSARWDKQRWNDGQIKRTRNSRQSKQIRVRVFPATVRMLCSILPCSDLSSTKTSDESSSKEAYTCQHNIMLINIILYILWLNG